MQLVSTAQVLHYIAECAESIIEDDLNESGTWTNEEFEELHKRSMELVNALQKVSD
jgi:hypothetical protein